MTTEREMAEKLRGVVGWLAALDYPGVGTQMQVTQSAASLLETVAAERDALRAQIERVTSPAYLTEALAKVGAVDESAVLAAGAAARQNFHTMQGAANALRIRAEKAEAEVERLLDVYVRSDL